MQKLITKWPLLILIANIGIFFAYTSYLSFNFPLRDDVMLIDFVVQKEHFGSDVSTWYHGLFGIVNDHSIFVPRLTVWLNQWVDEGRLNFEWITRFNLIVLILFFILLGKQFLTYKLPLIYLLPINFLLFHPQYSEVTNWPITGLQQVYLVFFVAFAINWLENKKSILIPLICAFLAAYSFGNGIALFVLIGIYVSSEQRIKQLPWVFLATFIYFLSLIPVYSLSDHAKFNFSLLNTTYFYLGILGSIALEFTKGKDEFAILLGGILVALMAYFSYQKWINKNQSINRFFIYLGIFVLGATLMIALPRSGMDWKSYHSSRYFIYSILLAISVFMVSIGHMKEAYRKYALGFGLLISISLTFLSYFNNSETLIERKNVLRADHDNWQRYQEVICEIPHVFRNIKPVLQEAYEKHLLQKEPLIASEVELNSLATTAKPKKLIEPLRIENQVHSNKGKIDTLLHHSSYLIFNKLTIENPIRTSFFLILHNQETGKNVFSPIAFKNIGIRNFITKPYSNYLSKAGIVIVQTDFLEKGVYDLFICENTDGHKNQFWSLATKINFDSSQKTFQILP
jgi:hypothetical protein